MSFKTQGMQDREVENAHEHEERRKTIAQVYQKYQEMVRCAANDKLIISMIERWAGPDVIPTFGLFQTMMAENPDVINAFATQAVERTREQIIEEYLTLLAAHSRQDAYSLKSERARLQHLPMESLRQKLAELKLRQKMAKVPVAALKAFVAQAHKDQSVDGYPALPSSVWDGARHVRVDATYLNGLAQTDLWQFKKLTRLYGSNQINRARGIK